MEVISMKKIKPYKGKFLLRAQANRINDALASAKAPDRRALELEAKEFIDFIKSKRAKARI